MKNADDVERRRVQHPHMKLEEIQRGAMELPNAQRAALARDLLESLPTVLLDDDDGVAEALRRSEEMDRDPPVARSWEQIRASLGR